MPDRTTTPAGLLRLFVLFHETQSLGASTAVLRAVPELEGYGWTAGGWFPGDGPLPRSAEPLASVLSAERPLAFSRRGWSEGPGFVARVRRSPAYLQALRSALVAARPHMVHANTLLSLPEASVARACGLPVVLQVHELPRPGLKRTAAITLAARVADVLVGVSEAVSAMLRVHAGSTPVLTVRNGVPDRIPGTDGDAGGFTVGTIGTVSRVKGTDVFYRAAAAVAARRPEIAFEHVGSGDLHRDAGLDEELAAIDGASVARRGVQAPDVVLPRWDVFVLSSRSEAFPLATLEAMAAGVPVVATAVGGVPEQVEHLRTGILVPPDDPAAIATWVIRLADDPALRARLGEEAARRVRAEFTLDRQAAGLHRAYLTALGHRFAPPAVRPRTDGETG